MRYLAAILFAGLLVGAPSPASATSCTHTDVVFYSNNSVVLAQRLHAAQSACADYYISVTPAAGGGPRGTAAPAIRAIGPQFHAMPELRLPDWATYVAQNGNDWYAAGVHVRDLMVNAGFDVSKGDTWAINEVGTPSNQMATDVFNNVDDSRLHLEQFVDGLYTGEPGMPAAPGLIFVANPLQVTSDLAAYKQGLDSWYQDAGFWTALAGKVRFWAQETYADARTWAVGGSTLADRTAHLEDYFQHGDLFVQADQNASQAARDFIAATYTPVGNSAYVMPAPELQPGGIGYGFTTLDLPVMQNFVSSQTYALREAGNARFGYAWWQKPGTASTAQFMSLADRVAASIQGSDTDPAGACSGDFSWCDGTLDGAAFTEAWKTFDDTVAPVLAVPADMSVDATGPDGAVVTYAVSATDTWDPSPTHQCTPSSGTLFAIGTTSVLCTAKDDSGNTATASFDVHVEDGSEQIGDLVLSVQAAGLQHGVETALVAKLSDHAGCAQLLAFGTLAANAERVGHISTADGDAWIADAERIATVEGCGS